MKLTKSYRVTIWTGPPQHYYFSDTCYVWPGHCTDLAIFPWIWFLFTCLAWENSRHLATLPLVSPPNDVWETSAEIPCCWRLATQIWVVLLIGWDEFPMRHDPSEALPRSVWWRVNSSFLRSCLRRHLAGKPVVVSLNVGCFLRLLLV